MPSRRSLRLVFALALAACKGASVDPMDAAQSPQAQAEPAPLANPPAIASATAVTSMGQDASSWPEPLRSDQRVAPDAPREPAARDQGGRDASRDWRELAGYEMQAVLRAGEGPGPPKAAEVSATGIEAAKRKTEARMAIEMSQTRARFVLSGGFVLPQATELRARLDWYGHLLLWPGESTYRVAQPGALRALLGERRLDVAPLSPAKVVPGGDGARRLNTRTRRVDVSTRAGKATMELASIRDAGEGGTLVCRLLLDLMSAPPSTLACTTDDVPLHAELHWTTQGALAFDVTSIARRLDLAAQELAAPAASLMFVSAPPPPAPAENLLTRAELAAFRTAPVDVPPAATRDAQAPAPEAGLALVNASDELRVAWIDGAPVAWVAPGARLALPSVVRGRYTVQWRTFLGDAWEPAETIVVPGTSEVGSRAQ
jgi:hypothetical protein